MQHPCRDKRFILSKILDRFLFNRYGKIFPAVKSPGCEADHSLPSSMKVKNEWSYNSTPNYAFMECRSIHLRTEPRLRVFENRVLRRIFGPKVDKVTGEGGKLHNEQPNKLYSPRIVG